MANITFAKLSQQPSQLKRHKVDVPEWGKGKFFLIELSGLAHQEVTEEYQKLTGKGEEEEKNQQKYAGRFASLLLARCLIDEDGQKPDEEWLMSQSLALLTRLSQEAMRINGLSSESKDEQEKKSEAQVSQNSLN